MDGRWKSGEKRKRRQTTGFISGVSMATDMKCMGDDSLLQYKRGFISFQSESWSD